MKMRGCQMKSLYVLLLSWCLIGCIRPEVRAPDPDAVSRAQALINQGVALLRTRQLENAHAVFSLALEVAEIPESLDGLGCVAFQRGDMNGAKQLFSATIRKFPEYSQAYANLAQLYEANGQGKFAAQYYKEALARDPKNYKARNNFGGYLYDNDYRDLARYELLKANAVAQEELIEDNLKRVR